MAIRGFFAEVAGHRSCPFHSDNRAQLGGGNQNAGNRRATRTLYYGHGNSALRLERNDTRQAPATKQRRWIGMAPHDARLRLMELNVLLSRRWQQETRC